MKERIYEKEKYLGSSMRIFDLWIENSISTNSWIHLNSKIKIKTEN